MTITTTTIMAMGIRTTLTLITITPATTTRITTRCHDHSHDHDDDASAWGHAHAPEPEELAGPGGWKRGLSAIVAVGLRPCSGAILVLVFALAQGLFWAGVVSTFVMGLGTAITVAAIATIAVGAKGLGRPLRRARAPATGCWRCAASRSAPRW